MSEAMTASYAYDSLRASPALSHMSLESRIASSPPVCEAPPGETCIVPPSPVHEASLFDAHMLPSYSDQFWFEDGSVVLEVGNTLYNVYRGTLRRQSGFFRLKLAAISFTKPLVLKTKKRASIDIITGRGSLQYPLSLDVNKSEFETLLSYMFPMDYQSQYKFTVKEWSAIVNVSTKLELIDIRAAAIVNILRSAGALDLIDIGRKHNLSECSLEGFRLLCLRDESLSLEEGQRQEGQRLGLASVITIAHARDMLAKDSKWSEVELALSVQFEAEKCKLK